MAGHIADFARTLRDAGIPADPSAVLDACRAASLVDLSDRLQFYWALRANFVRDPSQFAAFDAVFRLFWEARGQPGPRSDRHELAAAQAVEAGAGETFVPGAPSSGGAGDRELLVGKDLRALSPEEEPRLAAILQELLAKLATRPSRRERPGRRGRRLELRRTLRRSLRRGGELVELMRRERRPRKRRLAFLGDVSGSMDAYNRFFLLLAFAFAEREPRTEVYAFSTRLFRLTDYVDRHPDPARVAEVLADTEGWSGGTRIGACLGEFHSSLRRKRRLRDTIVVVLSDGWDRGDPEVLRREIARLKREVARIYWLNPLKGDPGYEPLCRGMAAVLPYLDGFHAAHNVESLARFARELVRAR